jgi:ABC-type transport system involved in cytochrome c biogenesis permease subunit
MIKLRGLVPLLLLLAAAGAYLAAGLLPAGPRDGYDLQAFGRLPLTHDGRVKPIETLARASLLALSGRQSVSTSDGTIPATAWLLDVMAQREPGKGYEVFRIDQPDLRSQLGLTEPQRVRFAFGEFSDPLGSLEPQARQASDTPAAKRDPFQIALLDLAQKVEIYVGLRFADGYLPVAPMRPDEDWQTLAQAQQRADATGLPVESLPYFPQIVGAYRAQDPDAFNRAVVNYGQFIRDHLPQVQRKAALESLYVRSDIFYRCIVLYIAAFLLVCASWLTWRPSTPTRDMNGDAASLSGRAILAASPFHVPTGPTLTSRDRKGAVPLPLALWALSLVLLALTAHTLALAARVYIHGRPPVTDLYSSAVFIGWFAVVLAVVLELLFGQGIGTAVATVVGALTLIVAHNLVSGDTLRVMTAVLDSNFWLSTHVIFITIGYATTFLAGMLGIFFILLSPATRPGLAQLRPALPRMIFGSVCFAMLFSFVGTVSGGIWADQSWGRFWGWDPKENGALLIVLWNALILHAHAAKLVRARGLAVLAVGGNIVTSWSWFGTNLLGIGLHSYGFMQGAMLWLVIFMLSQVLVITLGLLPASANRRLAGAKTEESSPSV